MLYYTKNINYSIIYLIVGDNMNQEKLNYIIGRNIKKYRSIYNNNGIRMTQEKLAEKAHLHRTYIGMVERAERNITLINMQKIASALGVQIGELLED